MVKSSTQKNISKKRMKSLQHCFVLPGTHHLCVWCWYVSRQVLHCRHLSYIAPCACVHSAHLHLQHPEQTKTECLCLCCMCACFYPGCVSLSTYLHAVDGERQQASQQVRPRAVVCAAVQTVVNVDVVAGHGSVGPERREPEDTCRAAVHWNHLWGRHPLWLWGDRQVVTARTSYYES